MSVFSMLIPLFMVAVVGGFIAYRNHKDDAEVGVTLRRESITKKNK